ncbi:methyltransferase domain-containing protein [Marivibrio halodurans]|uniref:Methyltransferase domain-containing protein n=1 Tax=Marivibrio halodurans TaxID=2039722 RepID=A0A8J7RYF0_9PROT|nr:class I SAM-dependent methyltransferase [Marivibrio halodurans]MBP5856880.1 methyltransferase domain-containing protein [Marivibrio halodurans]
MAIGERNKGGRRADNVPDGSIPFAVRVKAWWEGVNPRHLMGVGRGMGERADVVGPPPREPEETGRWTASRRSFCQRLWGEDENDEVVRPGGSQYSLELAKPMGLDSTKSAIDLAAGLGGGTRRLASALDLWIVGYESDAELAGHAMELSRRHGQERRAPIHALDEETFDLPEKSVDGILMRERFNRIRNKPKLLDTAFNALRPRGHLIITDFVLRDEAALADPLVTRWLKFDAQRAPGGLESTLWTMADLKRELLSKRLDLRIYEDESEKYSSMLRAGWARFADGLDKSEMTKTFGRMMLSEAEYWLLLGNALDSGALRYVRAHAIRGGETL